MLDFLASLIVPIALFLFINRGKVTMEAVKKALVPEMPYKPGAPRIDKEHAFPPEEVAVLEAPQEAVSAEGICLEPYHDHLELAQTAPMEHIEYTYSLDESDVTDIDMQEWQHAFILKELLDAPKALRARR